MNCNFLFLLNPDVFRYFKMFCPDTRVFPIEKNTQEDIVYAIDQNNPINVFSGVGWDFGDLFKAERILIVNGIEDCLTIEDTYKKIKGRSLNSDGIDLL
jgi:hypothetical protein